MALIPTPTSRMALGLSYGLLVACSPSPSGGSGGTGTQDEGTAGTVSDGTGSEESGEEGGSETGVDNAAPSVPIGLSPGEGEVVESPISLCWAPSIDPEGDPIAYRVELGGMPLGEPSTATCTEALELTQGQSFSWRVQAFDPTRAEHSSPWSELVEFGVQEAPGEELVFADDFEADTGWTFGGSGLEGHFLIDTPTVAHHPFGSQNLAQPGSCSQGERCLFTGHNPEGNGNSGDVDGGMVWALSPAFDLSGASAVQVKLDRFFFRSDQDQQGHRFRVELVQGGQSIVLEELDLPGADATNVWTSRTLALCESAFSAQAQLRVSAQDLGNGVLEAAVDDLEVRVLFDPLACEAGVGAPCDPQADQPCEGEAICCEQGPVANGDFRCELPEPGLDLENPPGAPESPGNGVLACPGPNLIVAPELPDIYAEWVDVPEGDCAVVEGCVGAPGMRRLLRFPGRAYNIGSRDLILGPAANNPELYEFSACHGHYHFEGFAAYRLAELGGDTVLAGHKQGFCITDIRSWAWPWLPPYDDPMSAATYSCVNQGLSRGWEDEYELGLDCQWIDVTDLPSGDYELHIELNYTPEGFARPRLVESELSDNQAVFSVSL